MNNQIFKLVLITTDDLQESVIYSDCPNPLAEAWVGFQAAQSFRGVKSVRVFVNQSPYFDKFIELDSWDRPENENTALDKFLQHATVFHRESPKFVPPET